jgi:hypothetical protein
MVGGAALQGRPGRSTLIIDDKHLADLSKNSRPPAACLAATGLNIDPILVVAKTLNIGIYWHILV